MLDLKMDRATEKAKSSRSDSWDPRRPQGNNLNFLRFFLACLVLYSHSFQAVHGTEGMFRLETLSRLTRGQAIFGDLAVNAFFVLSGFLITQSWLSNRSLRVFLWKRVLRIYPAYLVVVAVCLLVFGPLAADNHRLYLSACRHDWHLYALRTLTLQRIHLEAILSGVPFPGEINASTWSLAYEFWCYLGVALLGVLGLYRRRITVLALFASYLVMYAVSHYWPNLMPSANFHFYGLIPIPIGHYWLRLVSFFLAGACFYLYRDRIPSCSWLFCLSAGVLVLLAAAGLGLQLALVVFGTYALLYLAFNPRLRLSKFGRRGDLSYGLYLYSYPIQQLLVLYVGQHLNAYTLMAVAFPIACGFAWMSWHYVEEPSLRLKAAFRGPFPALLAVYPDERIGGREITVPPM